MSNTTWRKILLKVLAETKDSLDDLTFSAGNVNYLLDKEFYGGYGSAEGDQFIAWSKDYVYFTREYDGADYIDYVERNPK